MTNSTRLPDINTIIYATTLGNNTRPVFRHAIKLAMLNQADVVMTYAAEPMSDFAHALVESYMPPEVARSLASEGKEKLLDTMTERVRRFYEEELSCLPPEQRIHVEYVVAESPPAELILTTAKHRGADLIVMGSRSQNGVSRLLMGSTARKISECTKVPVMIVPN